MNDLCLELYKVCTFLSPDFESLRVNLEIQANKTFYTVEEKKNKNCCQKVRKKREG